MVALSSGTVADLPTVDALMRAAFDPRYGEAWTPGQCLGVMAMPGVFLLLAKVGDRPAGFALGRTVADECELLLIATDPDARRRGVGGALVRAVIAEAQGRAATRLHLEVRADNPAVALYTSERFEQVGRRRDYYRGADGKPRDALTFARDL